MGSASATTKGSVCLLWIKGHTKVLSVMVKGAELCHSKGNALSVMVKWGKLSQQRECLIYHGKMGQSCHSKGNVLSIMVKWGRVVTAKGMPYLSW